MINGKITFIGAGNMARSLIGGLQDDPNCQAEFNVADPNPEQRESILANFKVTTHANNLDAVSDAKLVVLAVKPQIIPEVAAQIANSLAKTGSLVVSIAAGIRTADLQRWLGGEIPIVRCMPNTPALVRSGATALFATERVTTAQADQAESLLRAVGSVIWVKDESTLDAVTAVSGSGPAYFFAFMEALEAASLDAGLSQEQARLLTLETAFGASKMALESRDSPAELRHKVTSKGGTTEAALQVFSKADLIGIMKNAVTAAKLRAQELGDQLGKQK